MEHLAMQLVNRACSEQAVASHRLANGMQLLAYPLAAGALVGLGFERDLAHRVHMETVLRKRASHPARFGAWLPALFIDGSCYVVRRVVHAGHALDAPSLSDDDLMAAQELLS